MNKILLFFLLQGVFFTIQIHAHGDLEERILKVTEEIKISPDSAYLFFKRGKLFYQHEEFQKSITDLDKSEVLGYGTVEQKLIFAKNHFGLEQFNKTLFFSDEILLKDTLNVQAIKIKAKTFLELKDFFQSAINFEKVINYANQTFPENYIDASIAWESLNNEDGYHRSIGIIKRGIRDLGELLSLYQRLISIEINENKYEAAIETQHQIINLSPRKETAYFKLSELYLLNNNPENALESLNLAKAHFNKLPSRLQKTSFMKSLIESINTKISQLKLN